MSGPVDVLAVVKARCPDHVGAAVAELVAFVENIAKPYSEPLNSMCVCKRLADRRAWMGEIRSAARAALAKFQEGA